MTTTATDAAAPMTTTTATEATLVPPSSAKPAAAWGAATKRDAHSGRRDGSPTAKRRAKHSFKSAARPVDLDPLFRRLDPGSDQRVAHTVAQRQKAIAKGKNTVGYSEYLRRVPRHQRRPRCAETPDTPDVTLDISNNRFYGMVRAWRVNLHKYDPPELIRAIDCDAAASGVDQTDVDATSLEPVTPMRPDAPAAALGLSPERSASPAAFASGAAAARSRLFEIDDDDDDDDLL